MHGVAKHVCWQPLNYVLAPIILLNQALQLLCILKCLASYDVEFHDQQ